MKEISKKIYVNKNWNWLGIIGFHCYIINFQVSCAKKLKNVNKIIILNFPNSKIIVEEGWLLWKLFCGWCWFSALCVFTKISLSLVLENMLKILASQRISIRAFLTWCLRILNCIDSREDSRFLSFSSLVIRAEFSLILRISVAWKIWKSL